LIIKACLILYKKEKKNHGWDNGKKMLKDPAKFLADLKAFDKDNIEDWVLKDVGEVFLDPQYTYEVMSRKSAAAATLCKWSLAVVSYNKVYKYVKPLKDGAAEATQIAETKRAELQVVQDKVAAIMAKVAELKEQLAGAEAKKAAVEKRA